jgi:hypothetical protein
VAVTVVVAVAVVEVNVLSMIINREFRDLTNTVNTVVSICNSIEQKATRFF